MFFPGAGSTSNAGMAPRVTGLALVCVLLLAESTSAAIKVRMVPPSPRQGDLAVLFVTGAHGAREVAGRLGDRVLTFFAYGPEHAALVGLDLETPAGKLPWRVDIVDAQGVNREIAGAIPVKGREFPVQRLSLPQHMVDLDPETERRAQSESARLRALYDTVTPERLWRGRFARPVATDGPGEGFGFRRIINGQPRMPHSGIDFAADRGVPVVAANRGRVALVADFFFPGRLVVLDHGLGLYTLYFHLDRIDVTEGALVDRGDPIGTVGATGRATGPHLHFGAQLRRARVDPATLLALPLGD